MKIEKTTVETVSHVEGVTLQLTKDEAKILRTIMGRFSSDPTSFPNQLYTAIYEQFPGFDSDHDVMAMGTSKHKHIYETLVLVEKTSPDF